MTDPPPDGGGAVIAMTSALKDAGVRPEEVEYVVAHGTGTPAGDVSETVAIKRIFGDHAYSLAVTSPKSMTGHTTCAAGALNLLAAVGAIRDGVVSPTINYEHPDPELDLDFVGNEAVRARGQGRPDQRVRVRGHQRGAGRAGAGTGRRVSSMSRWTTLDRIVSVEVGRTATAIRNVPNTLAIFDSHFPRFPVLPGVLILGSLGALAGELLERETGRPWRLAGADRVGFRHFVQPGDQVELTVTLKQRDDAEALLSRRGDGRRSRRHTGAQAAGGAAMTGAGGRRVVVTGIGLLTPLGIGAEESWEPLLAGRSAVGPIQAYDASSLRTQLGAELPESRPRAVRRPPRAADDDSLRHAGERGRRCWRCATAASSSATMPMDASALFTASGKEISEPEHFEQVAVHVRDSAGGVDMRKFGELALSEVHPLFYIEGLQGASLFYISDAFSLRGTNTFFAGGAEAGLTALGRGVPRRSSRRGGRRAGRRRGRPDLLVEHVEDRLAGVDHRAQPPSGRRLPARTIAIVTEP